MWNGLTFELISTCSSFFHISKVWVCGESSVVRWIFFYFYFISWLESWLVLWFLMGNLLTTVLSSEFTFCKYNNQNLLHFTRKLNITALELNILHLFFMFGNVPFLQYNLNLQYLFLLAINIFLRFPLLFTVIRAKLLINAKF